MVGCRVRRVNCGRERLASYLRYLTCSTCWDWETVLPSIKKACSVTSIHDIVFDLTLTCRFPSSIRDTFLGWNGISTFLHVTHADEGNAQPVSIINFAWRRPNNNAYERYVYCRRERCKVFIRLSSALVWEVFFIFYSMFSMILNPLK